MHLFFQQQPTGASSLRSRPGSAWSAFTLLPLLALLLTACGKEEAGPSKERTSHGIPVEVRQVEKVTFYETISGIGTLRAKETVEIRAEIAGIVEAFFFAEGEKVEKGDLLFEIDDEKLKRQLAERESALEAAKARVALAEKTFQRMETLWASRSISKDRFDRSKTDLDSALAEKKQIEASIALIRERLKDTRIRALLQGVVSERFVAPGDFVDKGDHLVTLFHTAAVEVEVSIPDIHAGRARRGQPAQISVDAYPEREFDGEVTFISPEVNEQTRDFLVKITAENNEDLLKPGAFATVTLTVGVRKDRPAVPEEALVATRKGYVVFVVKEGKAEAREVTVGLRQVGKAEIVKGLEAGETIVRAGHLQLSDGDRVTIQDEGRKTGAGHQSS
jgi:membrane fusion protein (multidrug efflux system)